MYKRVSRDRVEVVSQGDLELDERRHRERGFVCVCVCKTFIFIYYGFRVIHIDGGDCVIIIQLRNILFCEHNTHSITH